MSVHTKGKTTGTSLSRRRFLSLSAMGAAGALLAACGPAAPSAPAAPQATAAPAAGAAKVTAAPAATKSTVTVYECCWNQAHIDAGQQLYTEFQAQHPEITTNVFWPPPGEDWTAKLLSQVAAGDPIDIIWWCDDHRKFAQDGRLLDLQELLNLDPSFKLDAYQKAGVDYIYDKPNRQGPVWGLPTNYATVLLWHNKKMFADAGVAEPKSTWTYDDLLNAAKALTKTGSDGKTKQWGLKVGTDHWYYEPVIKAWGGGIVDTELDSGNCQLSKPESVDALQWLANLMHKDKVAPTAADMAGLGDQAMFISNQLAMGFWPEWGQDQFGAAHKDSGLEYGVTLLPKGPKAQVTNYWPGITSIMKRTTVAQAAWETAKFICGEKYQTRMTVELPESPAALISVAVNRFKDHDTYPEDRSAFLDSPALGSLYFQQKIYGKEMKDIVTPGLDPVWEGKSQPAEVVGKICTDITAKLAELKAAAPKSG